MRWCLPARPPLAAPAARRRRSLSLRTAPHRDHRTVRLSPPPRYLQLKIKDSDDANILAPFEEVYAFVEEARRNSGACLLHCIAGMSRSASLVIAYVMRRDSLSLLAAVEFVKARRPMVSPNVGFMRQLIDHERAATGTVSVDIDAYAADRFGHPDGYRIR